MYFGTKYREPIHKTPEDIKASLFEYIDKFAEAKSNEFRIKIEDFSAWKDRVKKVISNRILFFINKKPYLFSNKVPIFEKKEVMQYIKYLHDKYIIVVADKAANNYVIICKKYYVLSLMNELGIDTDTLTCSGNDTYEIVDLSVDTIIKQHHQIIKNKFNIISPKDEQTIPKIFWNAKLHKSPYKARFIAGARRCTTKRLSIKINKALQVIQGSFSKYCKSIYNHTGINFNWSISSSVDFIKKLNAIDIWSMQVFDFTTLYTNLELKEVENSLYGLIDLLYSSHNKFICVGYQKSFFSKKKYKGYFCFDAHAMKEAINFIINNTYISFGQFILKQVKGIPMGGNCSSPMADLTLCYKEFSFMKSLLKNKKWGLAKLLSNNSRYVDDVNIINYKKFRTLVHKIYPRSLEVDRNGNDDKTVNYLDVKVEIKVDKIVTTVYNKIDDFNFNVVMFTFPSSNIPLHIGHNIFFNQLLRYSGICSSKESFMLISKNLFNTLRTRGYEERKLIKSCKKIFEKDKFILYKYGFSFINEFIDELKS